MGNNTQNDTEMCCNLVVVQLVEVKELIRQWDPSKSLVGQEMLAANVVLQFDTVALKTHKELGKYFSKNCENIKSKDATQTAKGVQSRPRPGNVAEGKYQTFAQIGILRKIPIW
jgi:hypothetical protein